MKNALIVVDVQNDFIDGSLAVPMGFQVAGGISDMIWDCGESYDHIVATLDWHFDPGDHFSSKPDYVDSWPVHCVANTSGALLHESLETASFDAFFLKGEYSAAYSGFEGKSSTSPHLLGDWLHRHGVTQVHVCGIATDYCVKATALDAVEHGFVTNVLIDLCAPVTNAGGRAAVTDMEAAGIRII